MGKKETREYNEKLIDFCANLCKTLNDFVNKPEAPFTGIKPKPIRPIFFHITEGIQKKDTIKFVIAEQNILEDIPVICVSVNIKSQKGIVYIDGAVKQIFRGAHEFFVEGLTKTFIARYALDFQSIALKEKEIKIFLW